MLRGIHVPLVTPFASDGEVAVDTIEKLAHQMLDEGAAGLVALGTTGEVAALDPDERAQVIEVCLRVCGQRQALLTVGVTGNDVRRCGACRRGSGPLW
jgi:4-hydroxy-tetrahydrodipicolinate synthase